MSTQTIQQIERQQVERQQQDRVTRFRLDVAEWTVLRSALLPRALDTSAPAGFCPQSFGLDPDQPLTTAQRARAWAGLRDRGLATHVPAEDDLAAIAPSFVLALLLLLEPEVRVDVSAWSGDVVVNRSVAWSFGRTAVLSRRRRRVRGADGQRGLEQESVVDISVASDGGLLAEAMRALPDRVIPGPERDRSPVRVGWPQSAAIAQALRSGREDVAAHLSGLPPSALSVLGSISSSLVGGACVSCLRRPDQGALDFHGVWVWTDADVVELIDATAHAVTLRRTDLGRVRGALLTALTGLIHAEEAL